MRNENGGIFRRLLFLGLLGWGGWFLYTHWWPEHSLQRLSGRLESAINKDLTSQGITDRDVINQVNLEHSQWGLTWVETRRTIRVVDAAHQQEVSGRVSRVSNHLGCSFEKRQGTKGLDLRVKFGFWPLQRLELVSREASVPKLRRPDKSYAAFVIDDVAYETSSMDRFASLGVPLTFAILPREKHSKELAMKAGRLHFPVMLHLPMEPLDAVHNDPGPSGLYLKMSDQELRDQFEKDVQSVPHIVGINNHMGSAFTENEPKMTLVLGWVKLKKLYFLDSHTTATSVVSKVARQVGVPCLVNETFLDNQDDQHSIEQQLDLVMNLAVKRGRTIAIGHYRRKYLVKALAQKLPEFKERGVQIVALPSFYGR